MVRRRAKRAGLPPSDTPLGTAFFLLSILLALLFWAPVICMVMGLPWAPGAALICARIARRKQWDVRRYAIAGAIYSALLFWPWVYLTLHMSGRSVRPWLIRAFYICVYVMWMGSTALLLIITGITHLVGDGESDADGIRMALVYPGYVGVLLNLGAAFASQQHPETATCGGAREPPCA